MAQSTWRIIDEDRRTYSHLINFAKRQRKR